MHDLTDVLCRKYRITRQDWKPHCPYARALMKQRDVWTCLQYRHDPLLEADCRGCPAWEPPDAEKEGSDE